MFSNRPSLLLHIALLSFTTLVGQDSTNNSLLTLGNKAEAQRPSDPRWFEEIPSLRFSDVELKTMLQGIAISRGLNIVVLPGVDLLISINLARISTWDLLVYISEQYFLDLEWSGTILTVKPHQLAFEPEGEGRLLSISFEGSLLSIAAVNAPLEQLVDEIIDATGYNILLDPTLDQTIDGRIESLPFREGFDALMRNNGIIVNRRGSILSLSKSAQIGSARRNSSGQAWINVDSNGLVSLDLVEASINSTIQELSRQSDLQIVTYGQLSGVLTAKVDSITVIEATQLLLKGTKYTYRDQDGIILIGDKSLKGIGETELIRLNHFMSDRVIELIPPNLTMNAQIRVVKELNAVVVTATNDVIFDIRSFIESIDEPIPQVLIEALAIDFNLTKIRETGLSAGMDPAKGGSNILKLFPFLQGTVGAGALKGESNLPSSLAKSIGLLPDDFYITLNLLEQDGLVNIRSKPHLATLNGHKAILIVSTTQYFKFQSEVVIPTSTNPTISTSERFEKITAEIKLEITPWVSASGDITVEIRTEFSTPSGGFDPNVPPTINSRIIESTIRVRAGETIILGGLIQDTIEEGENIVPFFGHLPLIGRFFRNSFDKQSKSELVIYITPHIDISATEPPDGL